MSYLTEIQKDQQNNLVDLYFFKAGENIYRFTSFNQDVTYAGDVYQAVPIQRTSLSFDTDFKAISMTVTAPVTSPFIAFIANSPIEVVNLTVYQGFTSDTPPATIYTDIVIIFEGKIKQITIKDKVAKALCESNSLLLREKLPRFAYQSLCNFNLFDRDCGLVASNYRVETVISVFESILNSSAFASFGDDYFTGGYVESIINTVSSDIRLITNHIGNEITLHMPFNNVNSGDSVRAYPGCDKFFTTCRDKFQNDIKFMGETSIPSINVTIWGL